MPIAAWIAIFALASFPQATLAATPLSITTTTLPTAYVSSTYTATLTATGGSGTGYKWSISNGALPTGLTLTAATGVISGKPTVVVSNKVTFKVTDSLAHTATAVLTVTAKAALAITTTKLPTGYVGTVYSAKLAATGGSGTGLVWSISAGTLPAGVTFLSTGQFSGTPTATATSPLSIQVKDSAANIAIAKLTLTIGPQLIITSPATLPVGYVGSTYSYALAAAGGSGTGYKFTATGLPQGIFLSATGILSGSPVVNATSTIKVTLVDSAANTATATYALRINSAVATCTNNHQTTALVELHGLYTFSLTKVNVANNARSWSVGSFNANGLGSITNGVMDTNGPSFPAPIQNTFTGSYTVGSDGRGRMQIALAGTTQSDSFCFALDSFTKGLSAHAAVIEDDNTSVVASGEFFRQSVPPSLVSVLGSWVVGLEGLKHNPAVGQPDFRRTTAGYITLDGFGNVTKGEVDQDFDGVTPTGVFGNLYKAAAAVTGTYTLPVPSVGTPTGRGTIKVATTGSTFSNFVFYPAGPNNLVFLEVDPANPASGGGQPALIGTGLLRTATSFSLATGLVGSSVRSEHFLANVFTASESSGVGIDVAIWDGKGNFKYSGDTNSNGTSTPTSGTGTYTVDSVGRFAVLVKGVCAPCGYLTSVDAGIGIYNSTNGGLSLFEKQTIPIGGNFQINSFQGGYSIGTRAYLTPDQQTTSGEAISMGLGTISNTLDQNQQGETIVNQAIVDSETTTSTSGFEGRFLLYSTSTGITSAFYIVTPNEALSIPLLGGTGNPTAPLIQFIHQ